MMRNGQARVEVVVGMGYFREVGKITEGVSEEVTTDLILEG